MTERKVWLITGAGRGLGVDIAKAVLAAGHALVATGRDAAKVAAAVGYHDSLLAIRLDVTRPENAQVVVEAAVAKFGRIDVVVNNAGNFFAGFFEELSPEQSMTMPRRRRKSSLLGRAWMGSKAATQPSSPTPS